MPGGRPTKYTPELLEQAYYYRDNFGEFDDVIPSHIGLALHLKLNTDTLYDWAKQESKKEFSDILRDILQKQHQILISKGLSGTFNSAIAKLVLGKHGYHEKTEVDQNLKLSVESMTMADIDKEIADLSKK